MAFAMLIGGMTANSVSLPNVRHYLQREWVTLSRHVMAVLVSMWFVAKVLPVFSTVEFSLDDAYLHSPGVNTVSIIATLSGALLLPACLLGQLAAGVCSQTGSADRSHRWKLAFNIFLAAAILLPLVSLTISLIRYWVATSP